MKSEDAEPAAPALARNVVVVLNEPQDIVNIAGTARAMMNMGLRRLRLVQPALYDRYRLEGIAHQCEPIFDGVEFFDTLREAIHDAVHVAGTTARRRTASFVWQHPRDAAPSLVALAQDSAAPVALVFGREDKGLSNEDLDLCDRLLHVPTDEAHSSLNLAQAVLIIAYELFITATSGEHALPLPRRRAEPATTEEMLRLFEDVTLALERIEFFKKREPASVMRTLRAAARRADLNRREAGLARAAAIEVRKYIDRMRDKPSGTS
jgi:tRNA (cytidine32/uridine32-2'-O)-methyltransferase